MEIRLIIDDRLVSFARRTRAVVTRRRAAFLAGALVAIGSALALADVVKPHTFSSGTPISAAEVNENFDALVTAVNSRMIRSNTTIPVTAASGCDGLVTALKGLDDKTIASMATPIVVTVSLEAGTYSCSSPIAFRHANGESIVIAGAGATPADVVLQFASGTHGILVTRGSRLGGLNNLTVKGSHAADTIGLLVNLSSSATLQDVVVTNFQDGIVARMASSLQGLGVTSSGNARHGILSQAGSSVVLSTVTASGNGAGGFNAFDHGYLELDTATSSSNAIGYFAAFGGVLWAASSSATSDTQNGFVVQDRAVMELRDPVSQANGAPNFVAQRGGYIRLIGTVGGAGPNGTSPAPNSVDPNDGAVIVQ